MNPGIPYYADLFMVYRGRKRRALPGFPVPTENSPIICPDLDSEHTFLKHGTTHAEKRDNSRAIQA